ncbi:sulfotransferase 1E1-like isoform X2 [Littorina saxatilis]|uniref:Sulfotransferase domain-containing protein n=2 Tax=Littorina saxatilis TaxID=31220 RepID=A0AAN9AKH2_9CAEN
MDTHLSVVAPADEATKRIGTSDVSAVKQPPAVGSKTESGNAEPVFHFRVKASTEEHLNNLRNMPMREDDVIIAAYAKSGTHWLWEVVHMLTSGKTEYESRPKEHLMLEFNDVERFETMPSPRIINSHIPLSYLSKEIQTKQVRVLHVLRNPKDIAVSLYFHRKQRHTYDDKGILQSLQDFVNCQPAQPGIQPGCLDDYAAYLREMERWEKEHPQVPLMHLYFEDMKQSPLEAVKRLATFLGVESSESLCASVVEACSFSQLKKAAETKEIQSHHKDEIKGGKMNFYRKGEVGDWKNHFTVALNEQFDAAIAEHLKNSMLARKLRYAL